MDSLDVNLSPVDLLVLRTWGIYLDPLSLFSRQKLCFCLTGFWLHCGKRVSPTQHTINNGKGQAKMRALILAWSLLVMVFPLYDLHNK